MSIWNGISKHKLVLGKVTIIVVKLWVLDMPGVANKENPGYGTNVFRPVLRHDVSLEQIRQQFEVWEQQFSRQLASTGAKISSLLQTAQRAPSIHDSVINLGSKVIFENAEIGNIETYKVG